MKKLGLIILSIYIFTGCKSLHKSMDDNREQALRWCAIEAPVVVKQGEVRVEYRTDTINSFDTVKVQVPCPDGTLADCPPNRTKTIYRDRVEYRTDTIENTARYEAERERGNRLETDNAQLTGNIKHKEETIGKQTKWLIGLAVSTLAFFILFIRKVIP